MKVKFHPMKSKNSSLVLLSKKLAISGKLVKHDKNKNCFAKWTARLKTLAGKKKTKKKESAPEENWPNALQWSSTLQEIDFRQFSIRHGSTRDLGDNATAKDFFNLVLDNAYIDKMVWFTAAYARWKGDRTFTTTQAEISAYLRLNILIGIHELPQLSMYWDSDEFFGVEGFKKTIPKHCFMTLGKYLHLADPIEKTETISSAKFTHL